MQALQEAIDAIFLTVRKTIFPLSENLSLILICFCLTLLKLMTSLSNAVDDIAEHK